MWLPPWTSMGAMGVKSSQWCQWLQRGSPLSHTKSYPCQLISRVWRCSQGFDGKFCMGWEPTAAMQASKNMVDIIKYTKKKKLKEISVLDFCGWGKLTTDVPILNNSKFSWQPYTLYSISRNGRGHSAVKASFLVWTQTIDCRDKIKSSSMHTFTTTKITA